MLIKNRKTSSIKEGLSIQISEYKQDLFSAYDSAVEEFAEFVDSCQTVVDRSLVDFFMKGNGGVSEKNVNTSVLGSNGSLVLVAYLSFVFSDSVDGVTVNSLKEFLRTRFSKFFTLNSIRVKVSKKEVFLAIKKIV